MTPEHITCEQNSEEWFEIRRGLATASQFSTILAKGRGGAPSKGRATLLNKLAGEILTGTPMDSYSNHHMERGLEQEAEARGLYEFESGCSVDISVGFIKAERAGCSPDGLIGEDGMLELKSKLAHLQVEQILKDTFPPEHAAQCQGQLWISGRRWVDLVYYSPGLPLWRCTVERDSAYIRKLDEAVTTFLCELDDIVAKVHAYQGWKEAA